MLGLDKEKNVDDKRKKDLITIMKILVFIIAMMGLFSIEDKMMKFLESI